MRPFSLGDAILNVRRADASVRSRSRETVSPLQQQLLPFALGNQGRENSNEEGETAE